MNVFSAFIRPQKGAVKPTRTLPTLSWLVPLVIALLVLLWVVQQLWFGSGNQLQQESTADNQLSTKEVDNRLLLPSNQTSGNGLLLPFRDSQTSAEVDSQLSFFSNRISANGLFVLFRAPQTRAQPIPKIEPVEEPFDFYEELDRPPHKPKLNPESWKKNLIFTVSSEAIETIENARVFRAQLLFLGFANVAIVPELVGHDKWFKLVVSKIPSRSQASKARDFFSDQEMNAKVHATSR